MLIYTIQDFFEHLDSQLSCKKATRLSLILLKRNWRSRLVINDLLVFTHVVIDGSNTGTQISLNSVREI